MSAGGSSTAAGTAPVLTGADEKSTAAAVSPATTSNNPGSYEELHRKCRDVFPMCFEGAKVMVQKGLSSHFQVSHTLSISPANTGYRFGATFVGNKQVGPGEAFPVLLGDTDAAGNTSATFLHQFGDRWRLKLQSQVQGGKLSAAQGTLEYRGRLATLGLTLANTDVIGESGIVVTQLLRRITPRLDLGAELVYQYGKQIPGSQISVLSYAARYNGDNFTASGTIGSSGLHLCYHHKQVENLSFGVEFESNFRVQEALTTFAYQAELPDEGVTMRASIDTNWTVGGVFEKKLSQNLPFTLAISGMLNHVKAQGKFGIGLIIG
uniref:Mitochondrial import receptor subunit TOM40 homolog n=2 Tax=Ascaris TaxID=6251 RepID=A0A0M3I4Q7_ASCLU